MIDLPLLAAFLVAATVLTITPGLDTAMVLRSAAAEGQRSAVLAGLGICVGCLVWGAAVALGLGAVLKASATAYTVIKLVGAGYLIWIGAKLLLKPRESLVTADPAIPSRGQGSFARGLLTNLLNPKIGVFYVTFLPQFVPHGADVALGTFLLVLVHLILTVMWFALLIAATRPLTRFLRRPKAVAILDRMTGTVFVRFGLRLAISSPR